MPDAIEYMDAGTYRNRVIELLERIADEVAPLPEPDPEPEPNPDPEPEPDPEPGE